MNAQELLDKLWICYHDMNSQVPDIHRSLRELGERNIRNDHIAFRTYAGEELGLQVLRQPFEKLGWEEKGSYHFKQKKLRAIHLEHKEDQTLPKIFLSELIVGEFSESLQAIVKDELSQFSGRVFDNSCLTMGRWQAKLPDYDTYQALLAESEYAAWMYVFGICPNHFTVYVNALENFPNIEYLNEFLQAKGFKMNSAGGLVKGDKKDGLRQSSTLASMIKVKFINGDTVEIPGCYYEFAERFVLYDDKLFQGFVTSSADKIFQSTDARR